MVSTAKNVDEYIESLAEDRKSAMVTLRNCINKNIPKGFKEIMSYGMPGWVVPHKTYPNGYHCNTALPLPFVNIASQKNFIALYHMGIYSNALLLKWFVGEYPKYSNTKLDMGKSCIRFKKPDQIPFELIGELMKKMTVNDWIGLYEKNLKR
jgi:uncharacterized protein YdhG (YjbR/CyaY superfamily)